MAPSPPFHVANGLEWPWNQNGGSAGWQPLWTVRWAFPSPAADGWAPAIDPKPVFALVGASVVGFLEVWPAVCEHLGCPCASGHEKAFIVQKLATRGRNHITSWA